MQELIWSILCHKAFIYLYVIFSGFLIKIKAADIIDKRKRQRDKDEERESWKKKYFKYKNDNGPSIESLKILKRNNGGILSRDIINAMGNRHNFSMLVRYGFAVERSYGVSLEDIFMELFEELEDDLGGVDRY